MRVRLMLVIMGLVAGTGMVVTASPASALPTCLGYSVYSNSVDVYERLTTSNNSRDINCVLGIGNRGYTVAYLQNALNTCYGQGLSVDGIYGTYTSRAVQNVQRFHGIRVDGVFGPQTNLVMFWPYYHYTNRCYPF